MRKQLNNPMPPFPGFKRDYRRDFLTYPLILEEYWQYLSGSEMKILTFIVRQTIGWQKLSDSISIEQFRSGVGSMNNGTGLSKSQVRRAIKGLETKGFITVSRRKTYTSTFNLVLEYDPIEEARSASDSEAIREFAKNHNING